MLNHYKAMQPIWDYQTSKLLKLQVKNRSSEFFGIVTDFNKGFAEPSNGTGYASHFTAAYYNPDSIYYRKEELLDAAIDAMDFALSTMNEDGTIDLRETNFHDATCNGFAMHPLGNAYKLLNKMTGNTPKENKLKELFHEYTVRSGDAMVNFGFHTPNHRWVLSAALSYCYTLTGDERYRNHIQKFLDEGIDCDEEGEFTERSAGIYNIICDRSLITMAEELNMPELYEVVTRNLNMVMKYFEPDETLCTLNSTRQDVGKDTPINAYYEMYMIMAVKTGNPEFAWIADHMLEQNLGRWMADPDKASGDRTYLPYFIMNPDFVAKMETIPTQKPKLNYDKYFVESGIVRKREGDTTLTLIKDRPLFLKFQHKSHKVFLRFAGSFFGPHAQFVAQDIQPIEGGYRLTYHKTCGYKRPFETKPDTWVWNKMDHSKRGTTAMQDFDVTFDVFMKGDSLELCVDAGGAANIPTKLEVMTNPGGIYLTPDTALVTRPGDYVFLRQGSAQYLNSDHTLITIEGGYGQHWYGANMRGAAGADSSSFTVTMTGVTPEKHKVKISFGLSPELK